MKPLDPRLLKYARAARGYIGLTACLGFLAALLVIAQAILIAHLVGSAAHGEMSWGKATPLLLGLAGVIVARAVATGIQERFAHRSATKTIAQLREQILNRSVQMGPRWLAQGRSSQIAQLATRGLDDLTDYFVRYLPQLLMVVTVTPAVLVVILGLDWISSLAAVITLPLIPIFMILIGITTSAYSAKRLETMTKLGSQVLDLISGIPTLKAVGRQNGPASRVRALSEAHERTTMATLRVAFMSGAVLELLATLSVAIIAVEVGLRLVYGNIDLTTGIAVIVLAPEVFLPLRQVGTHYHASANGIAAADAAFEILDTPEPEPGTKPCPDLSSCSIIVDDVSVRPPGKDVLAPANVSLVLRPGTVTALQGPNGSGKTTTVQVLLGLLTPESGVVSVRDAEGNLTPLTQIDPESWWNQISWAPQRPLLLPGSVWENVTGTVESSPELMSKAETASARSGFADVLESLPQGWQTEIGQDGIGLSVGQRQRLALTRALLDDRPVVVLDEPTAHLDASTERTVIAAIEHLAEQGRTVLVVAHRSSLLTRADNTITVASATMQEVEQ